MHQALLGFLSSGCLAKSSQRLRQMALQQLTFLNAYMSDTAKKFTLDPQNNPERDVTINPVCR